MILHATLIRWVSPTVGFEIETLQQEVLLDLASSRNLEEFCTKRKNTDGILTLKLTLENKGEGRFCHLVYSYCVKKRLHWHA